MSRPHQKSLKLYSTQYGHTHMKIMADCLGSIKKVPRYMCYKFQLFISKRAPMGKNTYEYTINPSSCIVRLKTEHCQKGVLYQKIQIILDINK